MRITKAHVSTEPIDNRNIHKLVSTAHVGGAIEMNTQIANVYSSLRQHVQLAKLNFLIKFVINSDTDIFAYR